ncbi:MAG TPA: ACP S-malonyltransferase [Acidimicrobiia bacterium]|nr:ACP S-malonyltransferase [Acidimicrobiia bacterium]
MAYAVLFPGQGSQFVGMGADLFDARPDLLGERADETLGWSLRDLCLNGPEEELTRTEHAQPALFALSLALWDELDRQLAIPPVAAAGHSLGEFTALCAAGMIGFEEALRVVAERGRAMAAAADREPSGMAALLGGDLATAEAVAEANRAAGGRLTVANDNAPGQVVVAGGAADLDWLDEHGRDHGVRRAIRLKVAGAFHSPFMQPAAERVAVAVAGIDPVEGRFPVYANVTGTAVSAVDVRRSLSEQVVARVRFADTLRNIAASGAHTFIHVGPGDVTAGMAKRTVEGCDTLVVSDLGGIPAVVDALSTIDRSGGA